jgi:hypothetical protein
MPGPFTAPYAPSQAYQPNDRIAELLIQQGRTLGDRAAQRGQIWANTASNIGQLIAGIPEQRALAEDRKAQAEYRRQQIAAMQHEQQLKERERTVGGQAFGAGLKADPTKRQATVMSILEQNGALDLAPTVFERLKTMDDMGSAFQQHQKDLAAQAAYASLPMLRGPGGLKAVAAVMTDLRSMGAIDDRSMRMILSNPETIPSVVMSTIQSSPKVMEQFQKEYGPQKVGAGEQIIHKDPFGGTGDTSYQTDLAVPEKLPNAQERDFLLDGEHVTGAFVPLPGGGYKYVYNNEDVTSRARPWVKVDQLAEEIKKSRLAALQSGKKGKLSALSIEKISGIDQALHISEELESIKKDDWLGPFSGRATELKIKTPGFKIPDDLAKFYAQTKTLENSTIKAVTGAQMSEPEAKRIKGQIPSFADKPEVWTQKMLATVENLRMLKQRILELSNYSEEETGPQDPLGILGRRE